VRKEQGVGEWRDRFRILFEAQLTRESGSRSPSVDLSLSLALCGELKDGPSDLEGAGSPRPAFGRCISVEAARKGL